MSAVFDDLDDARKAALDLEDRGYPPAEISIFMKDGVRRRYIETQPKLEDLEDDEFVVWSSRP